MRKIESPLDGMTEEEKEAYFSVLVVSVPVSPDSWRRRAEELWQAAAILQEWYMHGVRELDARVRAEGVVEGPDFRFHHQAFIAAMLRAMSLECLVKAAWYSLEIQDKGHVARADDPLGNHNLVGLLDRMGVALDPESRRSLGFAPITMQYGRYPSAWHGRDLIISGHTDPERDGAVRQRLLALLHARTGDPALSPTYQESAPRR